jgi:plastocyanin
VSRRAAILAACAAALCLGALAGVAAGAPDAGRTGATASAKRISARVKARCRRSRSYRRKRPQTCRRALAKKPARTTPTTTQPTTTAPATTAPVPTGTTPATTTPATTTPTPARLGVTAREFSLTLSRPSVVAGTAIVELQNQGEDPHDLTLQPLDAPGGSSWSIPETGPGAVGKANVTLTAGTWRLLCTLPGHADAGMQATLTVTP